MEIIRSLSWNQPFGTLMLHGKIETRKRPTRVRGKVLICTCKSGYDIDKVLRIAGEAQLNHIYNIAKKDETFSLNGYAIGIGDLTDCYPMQKKHEDLCFIEYQASEFADTMFPKPALYCWIFSNVQRIEPFRWNFGKQGWGFVPESEKQKIKILNP